MVKCPAQAWSDAADMVRELETKVREEEQTKLESVFKKFDEYAVFKNDAWYKEYRKQMVPDLK